MASACCLQLKKERQKEEEAVPLGRSIEGLYHEACPDIALDCQLIAAMYLVL